MIDAEKGQRREGKWGGVGVGGGGGGGEKWLSIIGGGGGGGGGEKWLSIIDTLCKCITYYYLNSHKF